MRKTQIFYLLFLVSLMVFVVAKSATNQTAYGHNRSVTEPAKIEITKTEPAFAHCYCKVKSNGTEVDSLSFDGYRQLTEKNKCESRCRTEWDNSGPGNSQIVAWGKKLSGACGNVRVSMEAYVGTSSPQEVRSTMIDVGVPCGGGSGSGTSSNSVSAQAIGSSSIKVNFSAEKSPSQWKVRWSRFPLPPNCDALNPNNEATVSNTNDITKGSYDITGLKSNATYYCQVCALYNGPLFRFIGQTKAKTNR